MSQSAATTAGTQTGSASFSNTAPYPEWSDPQPGSPLRQGDVLVPVQADDEPWFEALVIITADCDLANKKHGGSLSCVPVIGLNKYLQEYRLDRLRERALFRLANRVSSKISAGEDPSSSRRVTPERLRQWVGEESVENVLATLSSLRSAEELEQSLRAMQGLSRWAPASLSHAVDLIARSRVALGDFADSTKAVNSINAEVAGMLKDLPGDALYLNEISTKHSFGFVAYLRRVIEVNDQHVSVSHYRLGPEIQFTRASRLRAPYIYALTAQFAAVFAAIGLPADYESAREMSVEAIRNGEI